MVNELNMLQDPRQAGHQATAGIAHRLGAAEQHQATQARSATKSKNAQTGRPPGYLLADYSQGCH
jgi:hypothetical protein